jgi:hypothetical protein
MTYLTGKDLGEYKSEYNHNHLHIYYVEGKGIFIDDVLYEDRITILVEDIPRDVAPLPPHLWGDIDIKYLPEEKI